MDSPETSAILTDIDGTLAPIAPTPDRAEVPPGLRETLAQLVGRYLLVAAVSGRKTSEARKLVGLDAMTVYGNHGFELLRASQKRAEVIPAAEPYLKSVQELERLAREELVPLGAFVEDKGITAAVHYRNVPPEVGERCVEFVTEQAERLGLVSGTGRGVVEAKPPVRTDKGTATRGLVEEYRPRRAAFLGDDLTDLDAFRALARLREEGLLESIVRVGVKSPEGPERIVAEADFVVEGVEGVERLLRALTG